MEVSISSTLYSVNQSGMIVEFLLSIVTEMGKSIKYTCTTCVQVYNIHVHILGSFHGTVDSGW